MQRSANIYGGVKNDQQLFIDYERRQAQWKSASEIHLNRCSITGRGVIKIMELGLDNLNVLDLSDDQITEKSIKDTKYFDSVLVFRNLTFLNLDRNKIGCAGAKLLTRIDMPLLNTLYLGFGQIGSQGAKQLSKAQWPNLFTLSIGNLYNNSYYSYIKLDGFLGLVGNNWKKYQSMYIGQTNFSAIEFMQFVNTLWTKAKLYNFWTWNIQDGIQQDTSQVLENRFPYYNGSVEGWEQDDEDQENEQEIESMEEAD